MSDHPTPADRRSATAPELEAKAVVDELKAQARAEDRARLARGLRIGLITLLAAAAFGVLVALTFDTRSVATGSTACSRGDESACRASADRIAAACSARAIDQASEPARALVQCRNLARALEPLEAGP